MGRGKGMPTSLSRDGSKEGESQEGSESGIGPEAGRDLRSTRRVLSWDRESRGVILDTVEVCKGM